MFDSLSWTFLVSMMRLMGFCEKWISWITTCITPAKVFVLLNGNPTKEFRRQRGVCHDDPLPSFLFMITPRSLRATIAYAIGKGYLQRVESP